MKDKVFLQYVQGSIEEYINRIYLNLKDNTEEHLDAYLQLLNNRNINNVLKEQVIIKVKTLVSDISLVEDCDVQNLLFKHSKVEPKWENILFCFEKENTFSPALLQYLNIKENAMQLSKIKMTTEEIDEKHIYSKLSWEIIHCMNINLDPYKLLAKSIPWWYDSFEKEKLDNERIFVLIENNKVNPNSAPYNYLKENFPDFHIKLIEKHLDEMLESKSDLIIDDHDLHFILNSVKISDEKKCLFLDLCTDEIILKNIENIKALIKMKEIFNKESKRQSLKISLMNNRVLSMDERIWLFDNNTELMDTSLIDNFLKSLGTYYGEIVDKSKKASLPDNPINRTLLTSLQKLGYISSFTEKGDTLRVNHRRSR